MTNTATEQQSRASESESDLSAVRKSDAAAAEDDGEEAKKEATKKEKKCSLSRACVRAEKEQHEAEKSVCA